MGEHGPLLLLLSQLHVSLSLLLLNDDNNSSGLVGGAESTSMPLSGIVYDDLVSNIISDDESFASLGADVNDNNDDDDGGSRNPTTFGDRDCSFAIIVRDDFFVPYLIRPNIISRTSTFEKPPDDLPTGGVVVIGVVVVVPEDLLTGTSSSVTATCKSVL
jgi:hypothetical protein